LIDKFLFFQCLLTPLYIFASSLDSHVFGKLLWVCGVAFARRVRLLYVLQLQLGTKWSAPKMVNRWSNGYSIWPFSWPAFS